MGRPLRVLRLVERVAPGRAYRPGGSAWQVKQQVRGQGAVILACALILLFAAILLGPAEPSDTAKDLFGDNAQDMASLERLFGILAVAIVGVALILEPRPWGLVAGALAVGLIGLIFFVAASAVDNQWLTALALVLGLGLMGWSGWLLRSYVATSRRASR
ncbi:MAG: hypothetical protein GF320_00725 [Armatimonadia bacterium]|nr:hypothetical protein [Armatimonadia bacterium]